MNRQHVAAVTAALVATSAMATAVAPSAQATRPATKVTVADLPRTSDLVLGSVRFSVIDRGRGEGEYPVSACQTTSWHKLGANATFVGSYQARAGRGASSGIVGSAESTVASFRTHARAVAAGKKMAAGFTGCVARVQKGEAKGTHVTGSVRRVTLPSGQVATVSVVNTVSRTGIGVELAGVVVTGTHAEIVAIHLAEEDEVYGTAPIKNTLARSVRTLA